MMRALLAGTFLVAALGTTAAQNIVPVDLARQENVSADGRYRYITVSGDPLGVRVYTLQNGLTVMMSVNTTEPRIQTLIAIRAGSKNDPASHTGLAHYLEHMLFKGTDRYGTMDWSTESKYIAEIEGLYEKFNQSTDPAVRSAIYHAIDSVSGVAARYAIPNEYDKLLGAIGARGTNAFTSMEETVYESDIPANQLEKWLAIEAERFRFPVFRLFHTELEAVYEEKNISLDNDNSKVYEALLGGLFRNHSYGTQTTLGTVEHLKNPSLYEIRKYFNAHYVPNNMAIILAGDFDPDRAIAFIDRNFGSFKPSPALPTFTYAPEVARTAPEQIDVVGSDAESVRLAYRLPGAGTREALLLELTDLLLAYKGSGLIDINLNQGQKVLEAGSSPWILKDYSMHFFSGTPNDGQSLEEVRSLLIGEIEKIKRGEFDEACMRAVIRNLHVDRIEQYENNGGRAYAMLDAFAQGLPWEEIAGRIDAMSKLTRSDVIEFANRYYRDDYVVVYKRKGEDSNVVKVEKPPITPVPVNRDAVSDFVKTMNATPSQPISPAFIDYDRDIQRSNLTNGTQVLYLANKENDLFTLYYVFDMGRKNDLTLPIAVKYLKLVGTATMTPEEVARAFFELGAQYNVSVGDDRIYVSLTGLRMSFVPAVKLFEDLLANAVPNQTTLDELVEQELKHREDAKLDKNTILWSGLYNYARYGAVNPFTWRQSVKDLKELKARDLVDRIRGLSDYRHTVLYYGPSQMPDVVILLEQNHRMARSPKAYPTARKFEPVPSEKQVLFVNYDGMVQAEIIWMNRQGTYDKALVPDASMFNQYYGADMSSVIFQELRESKALAYGTFAAYDMPDRREDPFYILAYIGTQADKVPEAVPAMFEVLQNMPLNERSFQQAREGLRNRLQTERITRTSILFNYLDAQRMGHDHDIRRDTYEALDSMTIGQLKRFHDSRFNDRTYTLAVLGDRTRVDLKELARYGRVVELSLTDVFGY